MSINNIDQITQTCTACPNCGGTKVLFLLDGKSLAPPKECLACMPTFCRLALQNRAASVIHAYRHTDGGHAIGSVVKFTGHGEGMIK